MERNTLVGKRTIRLQMLLVEMLHKCCKPLSAVHLIILIDFCDMLDQREERPFEAKLNLSPRVPGAWTDPGEDFQSKSLVNKLDNNGHLFCAMFQGLCSELCMDYLIAPSQHSFAGGSTIILHYITNEETKSSHRLGWGCGADLSSGLPEASFLTTLQCASTVRYWGYKTPQACKHKTTLLTHPISCIRFHAFLLVQWNSFWCSVRFFFILFFFFFLFLTLNNLNLANFKFRNSSVCSNLMLSSLSEILISVSVLFISRISTYTW